MKREPKPSFVRRWRVPLVAALVVGLVLIGYQVISRDGTAITASQAALGSSDTSVTTLDGKTVSVPQPGKATVVYFFATSCITCLPPLRFLATQASAHPEALYLPVSIGPYDDETKVHWFLAAAGDENRSAALDPDGRLARALEANALGTLIIFDQNGSSVLRAVEPDAEVIAAAFARAAT